MIDEALYSFRQRELGVRDVTSHNPDLHLSQSRGFDVSLNSRYCVLSLHSEVEVLTGVEVSRDKLEDVPVLHPGIDPYNGDYAVMSAQFYQNMTKQPLDGYTIDISEQEARQIEVSENILRVQFFIGYSIVKIIIMDLSYFYAAKNGGNFQAHL